MKKTLVGLLAMGALDTVASQSTVPGDVILNGDFSKNSCGLDFCVSTGDNFVKDWISEPEIEIGKGSEYNKYLGEGEVLDLVPNSNSCVKQNLKGLKPGPYKLRFEYASRSDVLSRDATFAVKYNNKFVKSITPPDDRIRTEVIDIDVKETESSIAFCSTAEEDVKKGAVLKSVSFAPKTGKEVPPAPVVVPVKKNSENLIINPDFEKNPCKDTVNFCKYNKDKPNAVLGWIPDTELEVGFGSIYNKYLGEERVLNLATVSNQCVQQIVRDLQPGFYTVSFEYTTQSDRNLKESEFEVSWEGGATRKFSPVSNRLEKGSLDVEVKSGTEGVLKFCSDGPNNAKGAVIRGVEMTRKNAEFQPAQYSANPILLDSVRTRCIERDYTFERTQTIFTFNYRVVNYTSIGKNPSFIRLNGNQIITLTPCQSGQPFSYNLTVVKGRNKFGFCTTQTSGKQPVHQVAFSDVNFEDQPVCVPGTTKNLVKNGNFENHKCAKALNSCKWNRNNIERNLPNWIAFPSVEVGKTEHFNRNLWAKAGPHGYAADLDVNSNTCIKQRIPEITKGRYTLKFDWAPKQGFKADSNGVEVKISGEMIGSFQPNTLDLNREKIDFTLKETPEDPLLEICGLGKSDGFGSAVDNVELVKHNVC